MDMANPVLNIEVLSPFGFFQQNSRVAAVLALRRLHFQKCCLWAGVGEDGCEGDGEGEVGGVSGYQESEGAL